MIGAEGEDGCGRGLTAALAHQPRIGPRAGGETQGVQDDRLATAGLAGERGQACADREVERLDQDHVADAQANQHGVKMEGNLPGLNRWRPEDADQPIPIFSGRLFLPLGRITGRRPLLVISL